MAWGWPRNNICKKIGEGGVGQKGEGEGEKKLRVRVRSSGEREGVDGG